MSQPSPQDLNQRLRSWLSHDTHPLIQFVKYGFCGGCAFVTYLATIGGLTNTVFPVEGVESFMRKVHYFLAVSSAFITSNSVGYWLNVAFVFKSGRHSRRKEIALFLALSGVAWALTAPAGTWAMGHYPGLNKWTPAMLTAVASAMINYAGRKWFVFQK